MSFDAPSIDYAALSPVLALTAGLVVVLMVGLLPGRVAQRVLVPGLTLVTLAVTAGLGVCQWGETTDLVAGALRLGDLGLAITFVCLFAAAFAVCLSLREPAAEEAGYGEYHALLLASVLGMVLLATAQNLIVFFVALETLSIPLYVLCATRLRQAESLESGLKYLVVGSLGSATLLYGLAFVYGGAGSTDFATIAAVIEDRGLLGDSLMLAGMAMALTGLAFKVSLAPFHQWTPDVYQGAPTPITAFMATATKAAAFAVLVRFLVVPLGPFGDEWAPALAVIAALSIAVGNIGAVGQDSLKRLLGYSGIAQAGYILAGLVVFSELGLRALVFYLVAYLLMTLAAFAVVVARERETPFGDDIRALEGLGHSRPLLAWPMTIAMLSLAGFPATAGFIGKFFLIEAAVDGDYTWLAIAIAIGTMVSLAYYLRVVAVMWMRPATSSSNSKMQWELAIPALAAAMATVAFGILPTPLLDLAAQAGAALF